MSKRSSLTIEELTYKLWHPPCRSCFSPAAIPEICRTGFAYYFTRERPERGRRSTQSSGLARSLPSPLALSSSTRWHFFVLVIVRVIRRARLRQLYRWSRKRRGGSTIEIACRLSRSPLPSSSSSSFPPSVSACSWIPSSQSVALFHQRRQTIRALDATNSSAELLSSRG